MTEDKEQPKKEVKVSRLNKKWCKRPQLGTTQDSIEYTDYSVTPPVKEKLEFEITTVPAKLKKYLMSVSSDNGTIEDAAEIQINYEDLLNAESLGIELSDILDLKNNKPIGVYESISTKVQKANGSFAALTKSDVEKLKNLDGQESSLTS